MAVESPARCSWLPALFKTDGPRTISILSLTIICCTFLLSVAVIVPTVYRSFHVVNYSQVAFARDVYGAVDTSKIYYPGRYFLLLTKDLVMFDYTYEPVQFLRSDGSALRVFLSNGVEVDLDLMFEYRVDLKNLDKLYNKYGTGYLNQIFSISQSVLKDTLVSFGETDYVLNRRTVEAVIGQTLQTVLERDLYVSVQPEKVQILNVYFADVVVTKYLESVMEIQKNLVAVLQQDVVATQAETKRQVAQIDSEKNQILATATIQASQIESTAHNYQASIEISARALGLSAFFSALGIADAATKNSIITYLDALDSKGDIKVLSLGGMNASTLVNI